MIGSSTYIDCLYPTSNSGKYTQTVWGYCFIYCKGTPRPKNEIKQIQSSHLFCKLIVPWRIGELWIMNIFQKIKLASKLNDDAEMIKAYHLKIKRWYEANFYHSTWVYHLKESELKALGYIRPIGCAYLDIVGDPSLQPEYKIVNKVGGKTIIHSNNNIEFPIIAFSLRQLKQEQERRRIYQEDMEKRRLLMIPARRWAQTVGAKKVMIFKVGTSDQYLQLIEDARLRVGEFVWLYKQIHGEITDYQIRESVDYIQKRIEEVKETEHFIERTTGWR